MNIHEYQAKEILRGHGVPVPEGYMCTSSACSRETARRLGEGPWVVKAQIHAGGRGKGGGVKLVRAPDEVRDVARDMLGMTLVTHQTGPEGKLVKRVLVEKGCNIARELYVSLLVDRNTSRVTLMASTEGGMDIEEVAAQTPEKIFFEQIDPLIGLSPFQGRNVAFSLGLEGKQVNKAVQLFEGLYRTFIDCDCTLVEINPLVVTAEGDLLALDAKMGFDDNALYRQRAISDMRDYDEEDPHEVEASQHDLSYISLDGNIGCMVNGAGPRHGHHGHNQALWRQSRQLSRRGRRGHRGARHRGIQAHSLRRQGQGDLRQHLRRHHEVRHHRHRDCRGRQAGISPGAFDRPSGRD